MLVVITYRIISNQGEIFFIHLRKINLYLHKDTVIKLEFKTPINIFSSKKYYQWINAKKYNCLIYTQLVWSVKFCKSSSTRIHINIKLRFVEGCLSIEITIWEMKCFNDLIKKNYNCLQQCFYNLDMSEITFCFYWCLRDVQTRILQTCDNKLVIFLWCVVF